MTTTTPVRSSSSAPPPDEAGARPVRWWAVVAAWVLAALVCVPAARQTLARRWTADAYLHAGVLRDIAERPLDPVEPIVGGPGESPYITPFTLPLGWLLRLTGGSGYDGLTIAAVINAILLVAGIVVLTRAVSRRPLAAPLAVIFTVTLWGVGTWAFSGVLALNSLGCVLPYPSTTGVGLMLLSWAVLIHFLRSRRWWLVVLLTILAAFLGTVHAFSAGCAAIGLVLIALWQWRRLDRRIVAMLVGAAVVAGLAVLAWPYYSVLKLADAGPAYSAIHQSLYKDVFSRTFLLLLCVPLLARRWWRDKLDPFALGFAVAVAIYAYGGLTGSLAYGRIVTLVALCAHLGAALELADWAGAAASRVRAIGLPVMSVLCAAGCVVGLLGSGFGLVQAFPADRLPAFTAEKARRVPEVSRYDFLDRRFGDDDVVLASAWPVAVPVLANGGKLVVSPYPDAFTPDDASRRAAMETFFSPNASPAQRAAVVRTYHVKWVLWAGNDGPPPAILGEPVARGPQGVRLFAVTPALFTP